MNNHTHLLSLPFELRDTIWAFCSDSTDSNGLLGCCRQTKDEFTPYCVLTEDVEKLQTLRIWVDSTYNDGTWLKFDYTWEKNGYYHHAISQVGDMSDPIVQTFLKIRQVNKIIVDLHAPRRGYLVGALFMMLAKADDVYGLVARMLQDIDPEKSHTDTGHVEINFSTETRQPGQTAKEAKNFWEYRSPKALQDLTRIFWHDAGQMPCFYEYFLISYPYTFPRTPVINYLMWPQRHVHRKTNLNIETVQRYYGMCSSEFERQMMIRSLHGCCNYQQRIAKCSANLMTTARWISGRERMKRNCGLLTRKSELPRHHWEHIYYDKQSLMSRFQFWLDNLPGPVGGHMDMLRLHRFKTMNKCENNLFARQLKKFPESGDLYGAATDITKRLATLFDPFTGYHVRGKRDSCSHFRAVEWATDSRSECEKYELNQGWLKFYYPKTIRYRWDESSKAWHKYYPKGIRYHWGRRNLVEWRLNWRTVGCGSSEKVYYPEEHPYQNPVCLYQWWDCIASSQDSGRILNDLALPKEREELISTIPYMPSHRTDSRRLMLVQRYRDEAIILCSGKSGRWTIFNYYIMGRRCWDWADCTEEDPYYMSDMELPLWDRVPRSLL